MSLVQCTALSKRFGSTTALDSLDLQLQAGEPIALIGPNGAGKTTLLSLLCGFIKPTRGSVTVLGQTPGDAALHGKLAALPQDAQLDPRFSIIKQLRFYARLQGFSRQQADEESQQVLEQVQLLDAASKKPSQLSHGMRKRIAIAQMLLGTPQFALLDEPTAGLDPPNVKLIRDLISRNAGETTFLISSHNLDELEKLCSSVIYLENGRLRQHSSIDAADQSQICLTIRLHQVAETDFQSAVARLSGAGAITTNQQGDYRIEYDDKVNPQFDVTLLQLLVEKGWSYKHLIKGRTLEEKLFTADG